MKTITKKEQKTLIAMVVILLIANLLNLIYAQAPYFRGVNPSEIPAYDVEKVELPEGYTSEELLYNLEQPICLKFFQDYMVVAQRNGKIFIFDKEEDGTYTQRDEPVIDISNQVTTYFERGLQSIEVSEAKGIYVYYTVDETYLYGKDENINGATINRVSRFNIDWENNTSGYENILIGTWRWDEETQKYLTDGIPSLQGNHQGGGLALEIIDADDVLHISTGDSSNANYHQEAFNLGIIPENQMGVDGRYLAQYRNSLNGKVLSIWANGEGFPGNAMYDENNPETVASRTHAKGYRNPFRITTIPDQPNTLILTDVGQSEREEINYCENDANGGWGAYEGFSDNDYFDILHTDPDTGLNLFDNIPLSAMPLIDYSHGEPETRLRNYNEFNEVEPIIYEENPIVGNSVTGGTYIEGDGFGEQYNGAYIFSDYVRGWINVAFKTNEYQLAGNENFANNETVGGCVDITQAPDGSLYFTTLWNGIVRISYNESLGLGENNLADDKIVYYQNSKTLKTDGPVVIYNYLAQKVLEVPATSRLDLSPGLYLAIKRDGSTYRFVVR